MLTLTYILDGSNCGGSNIKVDLKGLLIRDGILGRAARNVPL